MDRERALQYFKQLGFTSVPLHISGQQRSLSPREMVVEGDGLGGKHVWDHDEFQQPEVNDPAHKDRDRDTMTAMRLLPPSSRGEHERDAKNKSEPQQNWNPITICPACTCARNLRSPRGYPVAAGNAPDMDGGTNDADDDSDDDEGLQLDKLLAMMVRLQKRSTTTTTTSSTSTLLRLASCFSPPDTLTDQHINKLINFLKCDNTMMKETCLKVMERLLALHRGYVLVEQRELVDKIISLTHDPTQPSTIHILAMGVLDKLLSVTELNYSVIWERLEAEVYPNMLQCLHGKAALEVKYAACCIIRTLARDADFAARIKKEMLFLLSQLKDASARLKEVYVGVLMAMFAHPGLTEAGSVDTGVLPVLKGLLRDGPCETQKQALELLQCVMSDDRGVEAVARDQRIVAYVMACLLSSKCRKVRAQACLVSATLTSSHKVGVARSLLEGIGHYVMPVESVEAGVGGGGVAKITYPVLAKNQADAHLWHNLDCFLDSVVGLLRSEGLIEMETDHLYSELPLSGVSGVQVSCLSYLMQLVANLCTWPLQRREVGHGSVQLDRLDVTHLCEDLSVREKYSALNHRLAVQQWKRFGPSVFAVLRWMSQRIATYHTTAVSLDSLGTGSSKPDSSTSLSRLPSSKSSAISSMRSPEKNLSQMSPSASSSSSSTVIAKEVLTEMEWVLLHSLLNFLLCMTLITCKKVADPMSDDDSLDSFSPPGPDSVPKKTTTTSSNGLWVSENPHLTQIDSRECKSLEDIRCKQQEQMEKEALSDRRRVRRGLYNDGLFELLVPLMQLADPEVKTMCCLILRMAVQPLEEKAHTSNLPAKRENTESSTYNTAGYSENRRPQSALRKTEKQIGMALHRMSPTSAVVVKEALGHRPPSAARRGSDKTMTSARQPASAFKATSPRESLGLRPDSNASGSLRSGSSLSSTRQDAKHSDWTQNVALKSQSQPNLRPLVPGKPINKECLREAVLTCGSHVIQSLFCRSRHTKLYTLMLLHDLIKLSTAEIHMELSKHGIIPKLLDFIRVSDDDEQLEVLGLRVLGLLVVSDMRLQQLFSHHGGHTLLVALTRNDNPNIRQQVKATLALVTKGQTVRAGQRPASAPLNRQKSCPADISGPPRDIWEHIMRRWAEEDKVVEVLQKFK